MKMDIKLKSLELVEILLSGLTAESIAYCHWKSTTNLAASLSGGTDLDLLVDEERSEDCLALLERLNFLQATDPWELNLPGIYHYFGYDPPSGCLVHVHLHFQLIVGDDLLKNYRLPVEKAFLASAKPLNGIAVPTPEVEFITFVIRMTLKRRLLSVLVRCFFLMGNVPSRLKQLLGLENPPLDQHAQTEFDDLKARISKESLAKTLASHFPFVAPNLFQQCCEALDNRADRLGWLRAGNQLTRALSNYRRMSGFSPIWKIVWQAFRLRGRALLKRAGCCYLTGKTLVSGGRIIAFVGGDGAGKTTLVSDTAQWLGHCFSVTRRHLGKPAKGPLWFAVLALMKIRSILPGKAGDPFHQAVRYWLVARYRYRTYRQVIRLRQRGMVVLLDRIPLPGSLYMDTPRIAGLAAGKGPVFRLMAGMEERWHLRIKADELIVLRLDPKIAAERRPGDDQELLAKRSGEIWNRSWPVNYAHLVDASQPLDEVIRQVRSSVWEILGKKARVFELIGPAGSGKSTLAGELRSRYYNMQTAVSCRDHLLPYLKVTLQRLPWLLTGWSRGVPVNHLKQAIYTETVIYLIDPKRRSRFFPGRNIVLEIGPLFYLVFLEKESRRFSKQWLRQLREQFAGSADLVVWLDASDEILGERINNRSKWHRIKHGTPQEMEKFLADYRASFVSATEIVKGGVPIKNIDTGHLNIVECAEIVTGLLQEPL
jgi:thymidylate kinase